jgi:hypothetical protein
MDAEALCWLPDWQLSQLLEELAGLKRVRAMGWRLTEASPRRRRFAARDEEIVQLHEAGRSYGQLSRRYGISRSGIAKVVQRRRKTVDDLPLST